MGRENGIQLPQWYSVLNHYKSTNIICNIKHSFRLNGVFMRSLQYHHACCVHGVSSHITVGGVHKKIKGDKTRQIYWYLPS